MLGGQSVRVTYAHKRRRIRNTSKKLLSSPLEVLPPDMDDLTCTQMAHRMLKRSRRVALADQLEDKNIEHVREHLAKRIRRTQERVSNLVPTGVPFNVPPHDGFTFQTPFSSQPVHESAVTKPLVPDQLSPVPVVKHVMSRTTSRNLKENSTRSQTLASPFSSRPGSAASSPKHKGRGRSSRRVSRISLHAKSRTLSGALNENAQRISRKYSTVSLKDANKGPSARLIKHQRYLSSPSTSYMRAQSSQEDWIAPPKALSRIFDKDDGIPSPGVAVHSDTSFYVDHPQFCSTPAKSRLRKLPNLHRCRTRTNSFVASFSLCRDPANAYGPDVEMMDGTLPPRRQTVHLSGNSIFSSSDEFTIGSLPAMHNVGTISGRNNVTGQDELRTRVVCPVPAHCESIDKSRAGHSLAGSFIAEYDFPISDMDYPPVLTAATKMLGPEDVLKQSVGEQPLGLSGTNPARGEDLVYASRNPGVLKSSVRKQPFDLPGTSPVHSETLLIRTSRDRGTLASPPTSTVPSSPASDLAMELQSMDIRGGPDRHSDEETRRPPTLQARSHSLQDILVESTTKKSVKRRHTRNRAGTIRASASAKPGAATGSIVSQPSNVRRTRSGTVVGPDSKLAAKLPGQVTKGAPATRLAVVQSGSESESDDELLLKTFWTEDLEYLGPPVPPGRKDAETDELNLGGLWHGLESGPLPRPRLRRR